MAAYSKAIRSLLATSLGLPGMQELLALELPGESVEYRYTFYDEEPLPLNLLALGDPRRFEIESHQFRVVKNVDESYGLELNLQHETLSGSSPWYVVPGADGPLQVMSGATIHDTRNQFDLALRFPGETRMHRLSAGYSVEDDYEARYAGYSGEQSGADGNWTLGWGVSYSDDDIHPTDAELYGRVAEAQRDALSASLSATWILNRNAVLQTGVSLTRQSGYLSDPYKQVWIDRMVLADSRPDERKLFAWTTRLRQYFEQTGAALTIDYRYFRDDWEISAHTLDAAWKQPFAQRWELAPSVRYHSQEAPGFYAPYYFLAPTDGYWSSDYRLATYGALSYRLHARCRGETWSLSLGAEYYDSDESLSLSSDAVSTPGLVDFWRLSAALRFGF